MGPEVEDGGDLSGHHAYADDNYNEDFEDELQGSREDLLEMDSRDSLSRNQKVIVVEKNNTNSTINDDKHESRDIVPHIDLEKLPKSMKFYQNGRYK